MAATDRRGATVENPAAYDITLPAGWVRIPVHEEGSAPVIDRLVARSLRAWPEGDSAAIRHRLTESLVVAVDQARQASVLDLFIPTQLVAGAPLSCSFAVAEFRPPGDDVDPFDVLMSIAANDNSARDINISGSVALRTQSRTERAVEKPATPSEDLLMAVAEVIRADHRVTYLVGIPGSADKWISVTFNCLEFEHSRPLVDATIVFFDAIMTSFAWRV